MSEVTLDDWAESERDRIALFVKFWREEARLHGSEMYPPTMPPGEWDAQFVGFDLTEYETPR